jgi:hypothetical protein
MPKIYVYVGGATECMKVQFPHPIKWGVPFMVEDIFDDLFVDDPIYIEVKPKDAKAIQDTLDAAGKDPGAAADAKIKAVEGLKPARAEKEAQYIASLIAYQATKPAEDLIEAKEE